MILEFTGTIEHGKQLGRKLGFPTANILPDAPAPILPPNGVYIADMTLTDTDECLHVILNQGHHPTEPEGKMTIEAHALDYSGNLYGKRVRVRYYRFLREERKFATENALSLAIAADTAEARSFFEGREASLGAQKDTMQIVCKTDFERSKNSVTNTFYVVHNSIAFPSADWRDYSAIILGWWANEACQMLTGNKTFVEMLFMDGAYVLRMRLKDDNSVHIRMKTFDVIPLHETLMDELYMPLSDFASLLLSTIKGLRDALSGLDVTTTLSDAEKKLTDAMLSFEEEKRRKTFE